MRGWGSPSDSPDRSPTPRGPSDVAADDTAPSAAAVPCPHRRTPSGLAPCAVCFRRGCRLRPWAGLSARACAGAALLLPCPPSPPCAWPFTPATPCRVGVSPPGTARGACWADRGGAACVGPGVLRGGGPERHNLPLQERLFFIL